MRPRWEDMQVRDGDGSQLQGVRADATKLLLEREESRGEGEGAEVD